MLDFNHLSARSLKRALRGNAVFSAFSGLLIVAAHRPVLRWLGVEDVSIRALDAALLVMGFAIWQQRGLSRLMARADSSSI